MRAAIYLTILAAVSFLSTAVAVGQKSNDCYDADADKSIKLCTQAIKTSPKLASAFYNRGHAYYRKNSYDLAITDYNQAILIEPNHSHAIHRRGNAYHGKGNYDLAIADYNSAIRLRNGQDENGFYDRALAYEGKGENLLALGDYDTATKVAPQSPLLWSGRGLLLEKLNRPQEAIESFRSALAFTNAADTTTWAHDTARQRLAALSAQKPVIATPPTTALQLAPTMAAPASRRAALVIGVDAYKTVRRLNNSGRDAAVIAAVLREQGFEVTVKTDLDFADFDDALKDFRQVAVGADMAVIYYAGHGFSAGSDDIVAPSDLGDVCSPPPYKRSISVAALGDALAPARHRLIILDACRNSPSINCPSRGDDEGFRGLSRVAGATSVVVINSTHRGAQASDGAVGQNSPFNAALSAKLRANPKRQLFQVFSEVAAEVEAKTGGRQRPQMLIEGGGGALMACLASDGCSQ